MKMLKTVLLLFLILIPLNISAQDKISFEQYKSALYTKESGSLSRNMMRSIAEMVCKKYKVKDKENKIDAYFDEQFGDDVLECHYLYASKYLTVEDCVCFEERKKDSLLMEAMAHKVKAKQILTDSVEQLTSVAKMLDKERESVKFPEYKCSESYKTKWIELCGGYEAYMEAVSKQFQPLFKNKKIDAEDFFEPLFEYNIIWTCNLVSSVITEDDLDVMLKVKNSVANEHFNQYRLAMINDSKNVGEFFVEKMMAYFGVKKK